MSLPRQRSAAAIGSALPIKETATVAIRSCPILVAVVAIAACLGLAQAQSTDQAPDTMAARVQACAACHGGQGEGTGDIYFPRLAGKPAGYLYNQLVAFREGRRRYPPMNYLLEFLPDNFLKKIADYFATQRPPLPTPAPLTVSKDILAHGEALVTQGDSARGIPACSSCHGPSFGGMEPAVPGLLGLRANYISAQLGAWRYGTRTAIAPDCMQVVAGHLTEDDVKAIAAWLSSRPAPADPSPAPKGSYPLPFACGSEPN
jgi:cytochrome c553